MIRDVLRPAVTYGHRRILREKHQRDGLSDDVAPSDDGRFLAFKRDPRLLDETHDALGRAGLDARQPRQELARVDRMKAVHVLLRPDRGDDRIRIDLRRKRQLHENAVDCGIPVQIADEFQKFLLRGGRGEFVQEGSEARGQAGLFLLSDVDLRRRVLSDENDCKPRNDSAGFQLFHFRPDPLADRGGDHLTVKNSCAQ